MKTENEIKAMMSMAQHELRRLTDEKTMQALVGSSGDTLSELHQTMVKSSKDPNVKHWETVIKTFRLVLGEE